MRSRLITSVIAVGVLLANGASADGLSHAKRPLVTRTDGLSHAKRPLITVADGLSHAKRPLVAVARTE